MIKQIFLLMLITLSIFANGKPTDVDKQIMDLSINYEFEKADKLLAEMKNNGESLKSHFLYLSVELMKIEGEADKVAFSKRRELKEKLNEKLVKYAENVVEKYEDNELSNYDKFYLASIHGILGRLHGVQRSWMSAFSEGKSGTNLMEEVIEENPEFTDGYLLLGMMNYYTDRLGGVIEFVAGILGLSGDRNLGLEYLNKVVQSNGLNKWQATMILVELYSRMEGNKFEAIPLLEELVEKFPNNSKFLNWLCYEYMSTYQLDKIEALIKKDDENKINEFVKAMFYSNVGQYEKANKLYDELLSKENTTWPGVYENAKLSRIFNHKFLNDEKMSRDLSKDLDDEYKKYYDLYTKNFDGLRKIEQFKIAVRLNNKSFVEEYLTKSDEINLPKYIDGQLKFYKGIYHLRNENLKKAEKYLLAAKEANPEDYNTRVSQYLIHIYKKITVPIEKVENLLDEINEYDNDRLEFFAQDLEIKYGL